jgi:hypothetical protein
MVESLPNRLASPDAAAPEAPRDKKSRWRKRQRLFLAMQRGE